MGRVLCLVSGETDRQGGDLVLFVPLFHTSRKLANSSRKLNNTSNYLSQVRSLKNSCFSEPDAGMSASFPAIMPAIAQKIGQA